MNQNNYDELVMFVLETISSFDYLNSMGVYRSPPIKWDLFKKKVSIKQSNREYISR